MIHIRVNRDQFNRFVELHIRQAKSSVTFPDSYYVTIENLDELITTLQDVQSFMAIAPESNHRKWEVS